jgi:hypothetical protein
VLRVQPQGMADLRRLGQRLQQAPAILQRQLLVAVRAAADPAVADLQREIRGADVSGRRAGGRKPFTARVASRGLRAPIARAVEARIRVLGSGASAEFRVDEGRVPPRIRRTVRYVVGYSPRWRHPIMGNRSRWAGQNAPNVWPKVMPRHLSRFNREVAQAVTRTERQIQG